MIRPRAGKGFTNMSRTHCIQRQPSREFISIQPAITGPMPFPLEAASENIAIGRPRL
jgi:hypothetical protein